MGVGDGLTWAAVLTWLLQTDIVARAASQRCRGDRGAGSGLRDDFDASAHRRLDIGRRLLGGLPRGVCVRKVLQPKQVA